MNKVKSHILIICVLLVLVAIMMGVSSVMKTGKTTVIENESDTIKKAEATVDNEKYDDKNAHYMVKAYYDNIGVYISSEDEYILISIVDTDISLLPQADIKALEKGILIESKEQMQMLLEDYTS